MNINQLESGRKWNTWCVCI